LFYGHVTYNENDGYDNSSKNGLIIELGVKETLENEWARDAEREGKEDERTRKCAE
jgi:hypothetical protein